MTRKVELGAPSLTGKDANELVAAEFGKAKYPIKVTVKNLMPRDAVFPEVGLFLCHVAASAGTEAEVEIPSHEVFQRLATDVEQIAELNQYAQAVTIEEALTVTKRAAADAPSVAAPAQAK